MSIWGSAWSQLGAVGLVLALLVLVFTGRLLPRSLVKSMLDQARETANAADRRAERWQQVAEAADQRADTATAAATHASEAVAQMLPVLQTVAKEVTALSDGRGAV